MPLCTSRAPISLDDLEELLEVQVLLIGHHVQALVEVIGAVAERRREVAGDGERRAVAARISAEAAEASRSTTCAP